MPITDFCMTEAEWVAAGRPPGYMRLYDVRLSDLFNEPRKNFKLTGVYDMATESVAQKRLDEIAGKRYAIKTLEKDLVTASRQVKKLKEDIASMSRRMPVEMALSRQVKELKEDIADLQEARDNLIDEGSQMRFDDLIGEDDEA